MNHTKLEAVFEEARNVYANANPCGGISFQVTTFSEKPSLANIVSHYKDQGYCESELARLQYRSISFSDLRVSFQKFVDNSWVPKICVFVDGIVQSIIVEQNSVCILIQDNEFAGNVGDVVLSILSSSDSNWSLLDFYCTTD